MNKENPVRYILTSMVQWNYGLMLVVGWGENHCSIISATHLPTSPQCDRRHDRMRRERPSPCTKRDVGVTFYNANPAPNYATCGAVMSVTDETCACYNGLRDHVALFAALPVIPIADSVRLLVPAGLPMVPRRALPATAITGFRNALSETAAN